MTRALVRVRPLAAVLAATGLLAACGGEQEPPAPAGPLADALATIGGGGEHGSLGVGWTEPRRVDDSGAGRDLIRRALGPNADSVIDAAPALRRRFGFDPLAADRLISVGGSYAFGLRLDGVAAPRLTRALVEAGGRARQVEDIELVEIGDYAVVPEPLLREGINGLGAFDAFGDDLTVLAISDMARANLLGRGDRLLDEPIYRAAADCLGDAVAARMIPSIHLLSSNLGVNLVAIGVTREGETLCVLGGSAERAAEVASALETSLAPGARDPVSQEPLREAVSAVDVSAGTYEGVQVVQARLTPAPGQEPRFLFGAVARGSLPALINGDRRALLGASEGN